MHGCVFQFSRWITKQMILQQRFHLLSLLLEMTTMFFSKERYFVGQWYAIFHNSSFTLEHFDGCNWKARLYRGGHIPLDNALTDCFPHRSITHSDGYTLPINRWCTRSTRCDTRDGVNAARANMQPMFSFSCTEMATFCIKCIIYAFHIQYIIYAFHIQCTI